MTTLGFERGVSASMSHRGSRRSWTASSTGARRRGAAADPLTRDRLVQQWIKVQLIKFGNQRLFDALNGTHQADALRATTKLWWSRTHQETLDLAMDLLGPDGQVLTGDPARDGSGSRRWAAARPAKTTRRRPCSGLPVLPLRHDRRRDFRGPARHHRGADPQAPPGAVVPRDRRPEIKCLAD